MTRELATRIGARIALRIDDIDAARYRPEYAAHVFDVLTVLEIGWDIGPRDVADFEAHWSQRRRGAYYRAELDRLRDSGIATYACTCSRADIAGIPTGGCPGGCRHRGLPLTEGASALRVHVPTGTLITVGDARVDLASQMGDFIVWRRDGIAAYQWVSMLADRDLGVTHIVRGADLLSSSAAQVFLADAIGATTVVVAEYVHHPLVTDAEGQKLSKSREGKDLQA